MRVPRDGFCFKLFAGLGRRRTRATMVFSLAAYQQRRILDSSAWEFYERDRAAVVPDGTSYVTPAGAVFAVPANCQRVDVLYDAVIGLYLMAAGIRSCRRMVTLRRTRRWGPGPPFCTGIGEMLAHMSSSACQMDVHRRVAMTLVFSESSLRRILHQNTDSD